MKSLISAVVIVIPLMGMQSQAATSYDEAKVLSSTPIYRTVQVRTPRRECWEEEVSTPRRYSRDDSSATPEILGMVIGGALGNAVGHHSINSKVGTVVGAVLGGSIAHDIDRSNDEVVESSTRTVERCRTSHTSREEEKLIGYDVRYSYNGDEHTVRMDRDPGDTVKVRVKVEAVQ